MWLKMVNMIEFETTIIHFHRRRLNPDKFGRDQVLVGQNNQKWPKFSGWLAMQQQKKAKPKACSGFIWGALVKKKAIDKV